MLSDHLRVLYLHGFASSPGSRKAQFFTEKLLRCGVHVEIPALDQGKFENLTITNQLQVIDRAVAEKPVVLIGSSLGGYLAALYAARNANVLRMVLLAPAFRFHHLWTSERDERKLADWKKQGFVPIYHYGEGREMRIGYGLIEDAARYEPWPQFSQPALIFHGTEDSSVPVEYSAEFARNHPNARLIRMHSGHELTDVLEQIWEQSCAFLLDKDVAK
jgi:pimeloyl-ACP methyl ester carboxylesterase